MTRKGHKHKAKDLRKWGENKRGSPVVGKLAKEGYGFKYYAGTAQHLANRDAREFKAAGKKTRKVVYGKKRNDGQRMVVLYYK